MNPIDHLSIQISRLEDIGVPSFRALAHRAFAEFGDLGDFLWKSPGFIEAEREVEQEKQKNIFLFEWRSGTRCADAASSIPSQAIRR